MSAAKPRRIVPSDLLLAVIMCAFVLVPLICAGWQGSRNEVSFFEKRQLASVPPLPKTFGSWKRFPEAFDAFATDRFGFRPQLLDGYKWIVAGVFGNSISTRAFVGRDGWLFVNDDDTLADIRGAAPYTEAELRNVVEQINARGELLAVRGTRFGFVVFPDKHSVYPQYLPDGLYGGFNHRRLQALDKAMASTGHDYYVDTSGALRADAAGSPFQMYYKSDTHWNPWGAYLGYRAWVAQDGQWLGLKPIQYRFDQFRIPGRSAHGDLYLMSGYSSPDPDIWPPAGLPCYPLREWHLDPSWQKRLELVPQLLRATSDCAGGSGVALVIHDSFMDSVAWYVSENFARTDYLWKYLDDRDFGAVVRLVKPDVVLVERVERLMSRFPETNVGALVRELGVVGEPGSIDERGQLRIGRRRGGVPLSKTPVVASVERVASKGGDVHLEGWARMGDRSPAAIVVVAAGRVIAEAPVTLYRPDVARAQRNAKLAWSGFQVDLPASALRASNWRPQFYFVNFDDYGGYAVTDAFRERMRNATESQE